MLRRSPIIGRQHSLTISCDARSSRFVGGVLRPRFCLCAAHYTPPHAPRAASRVASAAGPYSVSGWSGVRAGGRRPTNKVRRLFAPPAAEPAELPPQRILKRVPMLRRSAAGYHRVARSPSRRHLRDLGYQRLYIGPGADAPALLLTIELAGKARGVDASSSSSHRARHRQTPRRRELPGTQRRSSSWVSASRPDGRLIIA